MNHKRYSGELTVRNVYGEIVTWKKFPIVFHFHKSVPPAYQVIIQSEMMQFNKIMSQQIFVVSSEIATDSELEVRSKDDKNVIYMDFNQSFNMTNGEQAKTSVFWLGDEIIETDINIQSKNLEGVDIPTLSRHEIMHTLGIKHSHLGLMSPYLPINTVRNYEEEMILRWRKEIETYTPVTFNPINPILITADSK